MATRKKMGRPRKIIDKEMFEKLCAMQCTLEEVCGWFDVSDKTLQRWCRDTYTDDDGEGMTFSEVFEQKRGKGKIALRRYQFQLAEKNAAMAIWLGKQWLGQSDSANVALAVDVTEEDPLSKSLREEAERLSNAD